MPSAQIARRLRLAAQATPISTGPDAIKTGRHWRTPRFSVVKITTASGLSGYGECAPIEQSEFDAALAKIQGRPATSFEVIRTVITGPVEAAINMALLDITGKIAKAPIYQVLGGPTRNKARAMAHLATPDPAAMNALLGTKFKIVGGYPGGNEINLAMEKGEVGGRGSNSWASWKSGHPHWIKDKKINILVQVALKRAPDLPDVPLMHELARNEEDRQVLTFLSADMGIARAFATTPGAPPERVAALRKAFQDMLRDPAFIEETTRTQMEISPSTGEEAQRVAASMLNMPAPVIAKAKRLIDGPSK